MASLAFPGRGRSEEPEWTVWLTVIICLLIGWVIQSTVVNRIETVAIGSSSLSYPANWIKVKEDGALFAATDLNSGVYGARAVVQEIPRAELLPAQAPATLQGETLQAAAGNWALIHSQELEGYRILRIEQTTLDGREAVEVEYAYLTDPPEGAAAGVMPGLMHAIDTLVESGEQFAILTVAVEQTSDITLRDLNERLTSGWRVPE